MGRGGCENLADPGGSIGTPPLVAIPLVGLLVRVPWSNLGSLLTSDVVLDALRLSLISSIAAAALSTVLGVPLAWQTTSF